MTITENYFKARGWRFVPKSPCVAYDYWQYPDGPYLAKLPNITQSFPDFKKFVLDPMEGEGFRLFIDPCGEDMLLATWKFYKDWKWHTYKKEKQIVPGALEITTGDEEIKNNEILEAAVVAATRYFEEKNDE